MGYLRGVCCNILKFGAKTAGRNGRAKARGQGALSLDASIVTGHVIHDWPSAVALKSEGSGGVCAGGYFAARTKNYAFLFVRNGNVIVDGIEKETLVEVRELCQEYGCARRLPRIDALSIPDQWR